MVAFGGRCPVQLGDRGKMVLPVGIEPTSSAPQADALSVALWKQRGGAASPEDGPPEDLHHVWGHVKVRWNKVPKRETPALSGRGFLGMGTLVGLLRGKPPPVLGDDGRLGILATRLMTHASPGRARGGCASCARCARDARFHSPFEGDGGCDGGLREHEGELLG